jgi:hypothetical protein
MIRAMTTAIAVVALVLSVISIAFTAFQWRHSGPVLEVALVPPTPGNPGRISAEVTSVGRMTATVRRVDVLVMAENDLVGWGGPVSLSQELPAKLAPTDVLEAAFVFEDPYKDETAAGYDPRTVIYVVVQALAGNRSFASSPWTCPRPQAPRRRTR